MALIGVNKYRAVPKVLGLFNGVKTSKHLSKSETGFLRRVEHQSVPLALDVVILRLLSDVQAIKLQLSGQLFLSLKDNQGDLKGTEGGEARLKPTSPHTETEMAFRGASGSTNLETVVADDAQERDDGVDHTEECQGWLHVACALFQEVVQGAFFIIVFSPCIESGPILPGTRTFEHARAIEHAGAFQLLFARWAVRHLNKSDNYASMLIKKGAKKKNIDQIFRKKDYFLSLKLRYTQLMAVTVFKQSLSCPGYK